MLIEEREGKREKMQDRTISKNRAATPGQSEKFAEARNLIQMFIKTIKSYRIYALNNPILTRFIEQFHQEMRSYTKKHGSFRFSIDEFKFIFDGEVIYENEDVGESLPFLMHVNGLRELWFDDGHKRKELTDFLGAFRSYEILKDSQEDLVTLLWDKEFSHIHFWATDDFLWAPIEIPEKMKHIIEKMEMPMGEQKNLESQMSLPRWSFKSSELDEVKQAIPQEIEQLDYINLFMTLLEIISHSGKDSKKYEIIVVFFKEVLDKLIILQDFKNLIKILSFNKILISDRRLDSNEMDFIQKITNYLGETESIKRMMASLARFKHFNHEQLQKYLCLLSKNAIAPLCSAWVKMESTEGRRAISNALVELGKEDIPTLASFLKDQQLPLVINVINILGKIGEDKCIHHIAQVKGHEHPKVRGEALHALSLFNHQDAKDLLATFLDDPQMQIRIDTSKILARELGADALHYLGPAILSEEFDKRKLKEKKAFLEALGKIQAPESVRIFEGILYRRAFPKRAQMKKMKSYIEPVLASMDIGEAKVALAKWKENRGRMFFRLLY